MARIWKRAVPTSPVHTENDTEDLHRGTFACEPGTDIITVDPAPAERRYCDGVALRLSQRRGQIAGAKQHARGHCLRCHVLHHSLELYHTQPGEYVQQQSQICPCDLARIPVIEEEGRRWSKHHRKAGDERALSNTHEACTMHRERHDSARRV